MAVVVSNWQAFVWVREFACCTAYLFIWLNLEQANRSKSYVLCPGIEALTVLGSCLVERMREYTCLFPPGLFCCAGFEDPVHP